MWEWPMERLLRFFLSHVVRRGSLEVATASGRRLCFGDGTGERLSIRFNDPSAQVQLLRNPELSFGELFMDGRIDVTSGTIYDVLALVARNTAGRRPAWLKLFDSGRELISRLYQRNNAQRARRNASHHYDIDGRLYALFLDSDWQYSCAYFEHPEMSLEEAQLAKKRHIVAKLLVEEDQKVLDIGCGWGGMGLYVAENCGARVTGVTLAKEQLAVAQERARKRGLEARLSFKLKDYRAVNERFERIVSVGMFEHVGVGYYDTFFEQVGRLLTDDGIMVLHSIGRSGTPNPTNPWVNKYIFPGGYIPSLSEVLPAIERAGLCVTDVEILRLHYAETLKAWGRRFLKKRDTAKRLYNERFCRMWEFYLAGAECGFRFDGLMVFQIQLAKNQSSVPLTRDYIQQREAMLRCREGERPELKMAGE
jgi:cyclopropane-fatty-acyl-phospholipid synthase